MCRGKSQCPEMTQWWFPEESSALATENSSAYWQGAYVTKPTATCRQEGLVRNRVTGALTWPCHPFSSTLSPWSPPADMGRAEELGEPFFSSGFCIWNACSPKSSGIDLLRKNKTLFTTFLLTPNILLVAERHSPMNVRTTKPVAPTPATLTRSTPPYGRYTSSQ